MSDRFAGVNSGIVPFHLPPLPLTMMTFVFAAIAYGNSLFGLLTHLYPKTLGQVSYSIYLLHGIALFLALR